MEFEQYFKENVLYYGSDEEDISSSRKQESDLGSDDNSSGNFDCNICLDSVQEPVVTLCGHLFCWPCIYKWIYMQTMSSGDDDEYQEKHRRCPVCKAEVSHRTLVPLYGRGSQDNKPSSSSRGKANNLGIVIPRRPSGPFYGLDIPRSTANPRLRPQTHLDRPHQAHMYYPQQSSYPVSMQGMSMLDPVTGMLCEMVFEGPFGNSFTNMPAYQNSSHLTRSSSTRVRRRVMQADKSLGRIYFFLVCCVILCLLLF